MSAHEGTSTRTGGHTEGIAADERRPPEPAIALWRGDDRADGVRRAMALVAGGIDWRTRRRVVVKPNLVSPDRPLSSTHPHALGAVLTEIRRRYDGPLAVAEGAAMSRTSAAFADLGFGALARAHGAELVDLNTDATVSLRAYDRRGRPMALRMARTLVGSDCRVSLSIPKTHDTVLVTLSIKNLVMGGLVNRLAGRSRALRVPARLLGCLQRSRFGTRFTAFGGTGNDKLAMHQGYGAINVNLALLAQHVWPHLAVLDGFEAMEGAGPSEGTCVPWGIAVAGTDALAVDGLTAELMGFPPDQVGYLHYCSLLGLGSLSAKTRAVVGNVAPEQVRRGFAPHPTHAAQRGWATPEASRLFDRAREAGRRPSVAPGGAP